MAEVGRAPSRAITEPMAQASPLPIRASRSVTVPDQIPSPRTSNATPAVPRTSPAITLREGARRSRTDVSSTSHSGIEVMKSAA